MFLQDNSTEISNHFILPDLWSPLNHAFLIVNIIISEEFVYDKQ